MNTHLETIFDPIKDGIEVCTMLRNSIASKANGLGSWRYTYRGSCHR